MATTAWHESNLDGMRIVSERMPSSRSVAMGVWLPVGSRHETAEQHGFAHFVEHMLFKGNATRDALAISRFFDAIGADANAATTKEHTFVTVRVLDRHLPAALDVIGEMVLAPAFLETDVDAEREVILEEIAMYDDSPSDVVHELADVVVHGDTALGRSIGGTVATVGSASAVELARFHRAWYQPRGFVVAAAGNIEHAVFVDQISQSWLRHLPQPTSTGGEASVEAAPVSSPAKVRVVEKDTEQTHVCIAGPGIARSDPRRHAAVVLDTILGGTPSSRLFAEIRERAGLAYSVYSFLSQYSDTGQAGAYIAVRPDRLRRALDLLAREFELMRRDGPSEEEVALAREHVEARLLLSSESSSARAGRLGGFLASDMPIESLEQTAQAIAAVTRDEVHELAHVLLDPGKLRCAAVTADGKATVQAIETALELAPAHIEAVA